MTHAVLTCALSICQRTQLLELQRPVCACACHDVDLKPPEQRLFGVDPGVILWGFSKSGNFSDTGEDEVSSLVEKISQNRPLKCSIQTRKDLSGDEAVRVFLEFEAWPTKWRAHKSYFLGTPPAISVLGYPMFQHCSTVH